MTEKFDKLYDEIKSKFEGEEETEELADVEGEEDVEDVEDVEDARGEELEEDSSELDTDDGAPTNLRKAKFANRK